MERNQILDNLQSYFLGRQVFVDVYNKINKNEKLPKNSKGFKFLNKTKESFCLLVSMFALGALNYALPKFHAEERDFESLNNLEEKKSINGIKYIATLDDATKIAQNDMIDVRNCFCHGLFKFADVIVDGRNYNSFVLYPNRSNNLANKPIIVYDKDVYSYIDFVQSNINKLNSFQTGYEVIREAQKSLLESSKYSDCFVQFAKYFYNNKADNINDETKTFFNDNLTMFISLIDSVSLYVMNQNVFKQEKLFDNKSNEKFFDFVRNSVAHGNIIPGNNPLCVKLSNIYKDKNDNFNLNLVQFFEKSDEIISVAFDKIEKDNNEQCNS